MVCADTSCWIAYLGGESGPDLHFLDNCLRSRVVWMAPVVLSELLSDPHLPAPIRADLLAVPMIPILPGFWERTGDTRARLIRKGLKPKLADTLIAQTCLDQSVVLLTRDSDFRHFAKHCGLRLV